MAIELVEEQLHLLHHPVPQCLVPVALSKVSALV
jgi:hypothetical protein